MCFLSSLWYCDVTVDARAKPVKASAGVHMISSASIHICPSCIAVFIELEHAVNIMCTVVIINKMRMIFCAGVVFLASTP